MEKVSVIIPVYNDEKYLEQCVKSALEQTYQNLEVILVDDGSTDTTPTLCEKLHDQDQRVRVLHKENGGVGSGLPMIGFDVPYGNPTFIDDGKNGHLLPYDESWPVAKKIDVLADAMVKLFTTDDQDSFSKHSYELAKPYLQDNIAQRWQQLLEELHNA